MLFFVLDKGFVSFPSVTPSPFIRSFASFISFQKASTESFLPPCTHSICRFSHLFFPSSHFSLHFIIHPSFTSPIRSFRSSFPQLLRSYFFLILLTFSSLFFLLTYTVLYFFAYPLFLPSFLILFLVFPCFFHFSDSHHCFIPLFVLLLSPNTSLFLPVFSSCSRFSFPLTSLYLYFFLLYILSSCSSIFPLSFKHSVLLIPLFPFSLF